MLSYQNQYFMVLDAMTVTGNLNDITANPAFNPYKDTAWSFLEFVYNSENLLKIHC